MCRNERRVCLIPYVILFICLFVCGLLEVNGNGKLRIKFCSQKEKMVRSIYVILPTVLILFLGIFRETTVGYDSEVYRVYYWEKLETYTWKELLFNFSIDNGFYLLLKIISIFTDNWWICRAVIFVITFAMYYNGIKKDTPYPSMSLMIFCGLSMLTFTFSILRQALAGALCLHAYRQLQNGSWGKCLLLIFLASSFHKLAFMCLLMPAILFFNKKRFSGWKLIILSVLSVVTFLFAIPLIVSNYAGARYENLHYSEGGYGKLLFIIIIIIYTIYLNDLTGKSTYSMATLFNFSCCALFVQLGALQWGLLTRVTNMFTVFWCMLLPRLINNLPSRERLYHFLIVSVLFGFMFFYQMNDVDMFVFHQF